MFSNYGIDNMIYGKKRRLVLVGSLAGTIIIFLPLSFFFLQALYFLVVQPLTGGHLLDHMGGFYGNLLAIATYIKGTWLFALLSGAIFGLQTLWSRFFIKRKKTFEFDTGGRFNTNEFYVPWDAFAFSIFFPLLLPTFFPQIGGVILKAPVFYFLSGLILYLLWSLLFEFLMGKLRILSTRTLLEFSLAEVFDFYEWHGKCSVEVDIDESGRVAIVKGHVGRKEQLAHVVSSLSGVRGILEVDSSGLEIKRPRPNA